jgi:hypothetical protein
MDKALADAMLAQLQQVGVNGWSISEFIDHGKSAAVFKATKGDQTAAIKVFDNALIAKYGDDALLTRMEREKWLIGHDHPNIVRMLESGVEPSTKNHFLVMEHVPGGVRRLRRPTRVPLSPSKTVQTETPRARASPTPRARSTPSLPNPAPSPSAG